jgi:type VI secretion system secreted protein VgrG
MYLAVALLVLAVIVASSWAGHRRKGTPVGTRFRVAGLMGCVLAVSILVATNADAAIVPTVPLATSANYAVLAGTTVTNTGNSVLNGSLGVAPGSSITGFPPGLVVAPGTTDVNNPAAQQAQVDLTAAYNNAAGRAVNMTTTSDLANLNLQGGVYAGPNKSPLTLTGPLTLDGAGDPSTVFVFQTDSTLITGAASTVTLINGAQECNVFWQVGSSATLGATSVFSGNILALTSITVENSATIHGRALARNGAVTLDNDTFTQPTCALAPPPTTTTTTSPSGATTTTTPSGATTTTLSGGISTTSTAVTPTTPTPGLTPRVPAVPAVPSFTG